MPESEAQPAHVPGQLVTRRVWPAATRVHALTVLAACGGNCEEASRLTGVPPRTIAFWRDRPASGRDRASLAVREELMSQSMERLLWKLGRAARSKIGEAKLGQTLAGFAAVFDRWRTLRDRVNSGAAGAGAVGTLDLDKLSSSELRTLLDLMAKAGSAVIPEGAAPCDASAAAPYDDLPQALADAATLEGGPVSHQVLTIDQLTEGGGRGVPEAAGHLDPPVLSGNPNSNDLGL